MQKIYTLFFSLIITFSLNAQVNNITIIPGSPLSTDFVKMVVSTTFTTSACNVLSSSVYPTGSYINVDACYNDGGIAGTCSSIDTFDLGMLSGGIHHAVINVKRVSPGGFLTCPSTVLQSQVSSFFVTAVVGINSPDANSLSFEIYPNPGSGELTFNYSITANNATAMFYNMVGETVKKINLDQNSNSLKADLSSLSKGVYFCRIETPTLSSKTQKITISE